MNQDSPIILIAGQKKCGKSSIVDVVFKRMSVYNTFFLDTNASLKKYTSTVNPFLDYNVWELSSDINEVRAEMVNIQPYIHQIAVFIYVFNLEVRFEFHLQRIELQLWERWNGLSEYGIRTHRNSINVVE